MNIDEMAVNDPEVAARLKRLQEKLGLTPAPVQGEEVMQDAPEVPEEPLNEPAKQLTGEDVDWGDFDLDPNIAHLYRVAKFTETLDGPKWVALLEVIEFESAEYKVSKAMQKQGKQSLGDLTTQRVNGSDRWRIATVFASGPGHGVVMFTRTAQIVLPDPRMLKTEAEMPAPHTDPQLQATEDAALSWIEEQGQDQMPETVILSPLAVEAGEAAAAALEQVELPLDVEEK